MSYPLDVLMLSTDKFALDATSAVRGRLREYAKEFSSLHVLVFGIHGEPIIDGNLTLEPVSVFFKPWTSWIVEGAITRVLKQKPFAVVSAQDPFEIGLGALWAVQGTNVRLHIQAHTDFLSPEFSKESFKNRTRIKIASKVLLKANGIRVVTERIKQSLLTKYGTKIVEPIVIPIVAPVVEYQPTPLPTHSFTFSLIAISRLEREKHLEDVIQALAYVHARYPATGLFIVGEGREKTTLMKKVTRLGLADNVVFLGWRTDAQQLMRSANAFVQASGYEGYGMTLVEAALAKTPIVTTDVGIVGEVLRPNKDVLVAPIGAPAGLALDIIRLIEDNQLRMALATEASHTIRNHLAAHMDQPHEIAIDIARAAGMSV